MEGSNGRETRINSFALVSYLPGAMAELLDEIRHDFAPESRAKAHVTILPPRPLVQFPGETPEKAIAEAMDELKVRIQEFPPFNLELGEIEVFKDTQVIYVSVQTGFAELERAHSALNTGRVAFREPYPYHPHVTIAQELAAADVQNAVEFARRRWSEFKHSRSAWIDRLTFVQNTLDNCWTDLAMLNLGSPVVR
ncbi:MAG: 2'-5' RNA ligase family protein [Acidobacteriota bacterium]